MPSIKTALKAIVGRTVATEHATLLAAITDREQRLREAPRIKARISDCRERVRGNESRQVKLNSALRGYAEDPKKWASHDRDARAERAELHRANEALAREIAADEKALSEIAAFALPEVTPDLMRYHRERTRANWGPCASGLRTGRQRSSTGWCRPPCLATCRPHQS
jgi:hypothetical protein